MNLSEMATGVARSGDGKQSSRMVRPDCTTAISATAVALFALGGSLGAQVTERVSLGPGYVQSNSGSDTTQFGRYISSDGRFVAFMGDGSLAGYSILGAVVLLRDRQSGTTECVSLNAAGAARVGAGHQGLAVSGDGQFVVFRSQASDLVPGDTNGLDDVFLRDRSNGTTERVSIDSLGVEANGTSEYPSITDDGRFVVFHSYATNLVSGDTNGCVDVFVRDRSGGTTERVSLSSTGAQGDGDSYFATISADGRFVAFASSATNLVSGDSNGRIDIFVRDRQTGITRRASVASDGTESDGDSSIGVIAAHGRYVTFTSSATNLIPTDGNGMSDVFTRDLQAGTTERLSVGMGGVDPDGDSGWPSISDDGRFVSFRSNAGNLVPGAMYFHGDIYVCDRVNGMTEVVSVTTGGAFANSGCNMPWLSGEGRFVAFRSYASDFIQGDTNGFDDIFLHDRAAAGVTSLCSPGIDNVRSCPCGNPPVGPDRGCDNSSSTGGAFLTAGGIAYLNQDSLVFSTQLERPGATSILLEGTAALSNGMAFGQGVRCVGGTLKRMYAKTAFNGSISAPEAGTNDLPVSARSAQLGVPIQAGVSLYYLVYYRDSTVLGGCSAANTFNATQTCSIGWWP